jgi:hypothetical protein
VYALDIITAAGRILGAVADNEVPTTSEAQDGFTVLNELIDQWNSQRLTIFTEQRQIADSSNNPFYLTPGTQTYPVGSSAAAPFDIPRPPRIDRMGVLLLNNPLQPLELPLQMMTVAQWQAIPVKNIQSAVPRSCWCDYQFPNLNLNFYPVPNVQVQVALYLWQALSSFADLSTTSYTFPPAYARALKYAAAVEFASEIFGLPEVPPWVQIKADKSLGFVKSINMFDVDLTCDPALVDPSKQLFNWLTGEAVRTGSWGL